MHTAMVNRMATDASERFMVTASDDKTARVWDLRSGNLLKVLRPPQGDGDDGKLYAVAMSPDGTTVAVGGFGFAGQSRSIYFFDRASGALTKHIGLGITAVDHLSYSVDGRYLVAALGGKNGIRVYRTSDNQEVARDAGYDGDSYWAEFDRSGRLVTACFDGALRLYDASFRLIEKRQVRGGKQPFSARFSPDGSKIAVGFNDSTAVNVLSGWDLTLLYPADTSQFKSGNLLSVAWSSDGQLLYAGKGLEGDGETFPIVRWPNAGRAPAVRWATAHNTIMDLQALTEGRLLFGTGDPALGMLDSGGRVVWQHMPEILDHRDNRDKFRLSRDGSIVEFGFKVLSPRGDWIRRIARFNVAERKLQLDPATDSSLTTPRTTGLNIDDWDNKYNPKLNGRVLPLDNYEASRSLAISASSDAFLLGSEFWLRLYDRSGKTLWNESLPGVAWDVNLTQDGRYAVAAFGDGTIRWYAREDGKEVLALFVHPDGKRWVAWTPEGFFDASPGGDALIGYHLNQGADRAGEFIRVDQVFNLFYRSDLVTGRLKPNGAQAVLAARNEIGDVAGIIKGGLPPQLALVSPAETQSQGDFLFQFRVTDTGGGIGRVVYRIDGVEIEGRDAGPVLPGQGVQNRRFSLSPGQHDISATVFNGKNQLESRSIAAKVNVTAAAQQPALYVVAAGITHYRDHSLDDGVKFASADAAALVARLQSQARGLFDRVNPYPLFDDKATSDGIGKAVADAASRIQPSDVFVLYLAGHGTAIDGQYYYVPWEVRYTSEAALKQQSIDEEAVRKLLAKIPAKKTLLILDTCNAGTFSNGRLGPGEKAAVTRLAKITGRAVLGASASDQMALEGYEGHSVLMAAILDALSKVADTGGQVQVTALADFVVDRVPAITQERWHYEQLPMWEFQGQTFPIARKP